MKKIKMTRVKWSEVSHGQHFFDRAGNEYIKIREINVDASELVTGEDPRVNCMSYEYNDSRDGFMVGTLHFVPDDCDEVYIT